MLKLIAIAFLKTTEGSVAYPLPSRMTQMLDDMQHYYDGPDSRYNRKFLTKLKQCFLEFDDDTLLPSQEIAWDKIHGYWLSNGSEHNSMGRRDIWDDGRGEKHDPRIMRRTPGYFGDDKMLIYQPCNYVSNMAFYHSVTRICDYGDSWNFDTEYVRALKRSFAELAMGSAFKHGSDTGAGGKFDTMMISVVS